MDQRGHGDADKPAGGYALTDFAADVQAFMDAMDLRSAVLLGSSSGGYVAQQVAIGIPDRVSGLVLVGAPRSLRGRPSFADEVERVDDGVPAPAYAWRQALAGLTTPRPPTQTGTIAAPTLVIWGARDELLPWEEERALAAAIPGSRLVVYQGTGHLVLWEQPERVAGDLAAFVDSLPS